MKTNGLLTLSMILIGLQGFTVAAHAAAGDLPNLSCKQLTALVARQGDEGLSTLTPTFANVAYGLAPLQKLDVYRDPKFAKTLEPLPIIFMVHGGAWCIGDKSVTKVVDNKVTRWTPKGFIFISVNNRMVPDGADPYVQATDVATALAYVQANAEKWNGDPKKIILMGHSAGAHLVSLVSTSGEIKRATGVKPILGTVSLDSAVMNVPEIMNMTHYPFYDDAFGTDKKFWVKTSPYHQIPTSTMSPLLGVCGTGRPDSCPQAHDFITKAGKGQVLEQDLSHGEINELLGLPGSYTDAVETFMGSLDTTVKRRLATPAAGTVTTSPVKSVERPVPIEDPTILPTTY